MPPKTKWKDGPINGRKNFVSLENKNIFNKLKRSQSCNTKNYERGQGT